MARRRSRAMPKQPHAVHETEATMRRQFMVKGLAVLGVGLTLGQGMAQNLGNLFQMMGGMDTVKKLSGDFLQSAAKDPRLSGMLSKTDTSAIAPKLSDQMCSML